MLTTDADILDDLCKQFRHWLEQQNPQIGFNYTDTTDCVFARFLKASGYPDCQVFRWGVHLSTPVNANIGPTTSVRYDLIDAAIRASFTLGGRAPLTYGGVLHALIVARL